MSVILNHAKLKRFDAWYIEAIEHGDIALSEEIMATARAYVESVYARRRQAQ